MKNRRSLLALVGLLVAVASLSAFTTSFGFIDILQNQLKTYNAAYTQQKLYLHTDRPYYVAGERLYFKAYITDIYSLLPTGKNELIYVSLRQNGVETLSAKIITDRGLGSGSIELPKELLSGNYELVAHTNWMKNFDEQFFFKKELAIYNSSEDYIAPCEPESEKIALSFFPEGGNMVTGLVNRIGFKAIDNSGKGLTVKGRIIDADGAEVTQFESLHAGMGSFILKPSKGETYYAVLQGEYSRKFELPKAEETGIVMQVYSVSSHIRVAVQSNMEAYEGKLTLVAQSRGEILTYVEQEHSTKGMAVRIPKEKLPAGVIQLTMFDQAGKPLAERLSFVNRPKEAALSINTTATSFQTREKVMVDLGLEAAEVANVSVSIHNRGGNTHDIEEYLLLSSDLRGTIEAPSYYFDDTNEKASAALDNLLLTQGWRRFTWDKVMDEEQSSPTFNAEYDFMLVKGIVYDDKDKPVPNETFFVEAPNQLRAYEATTDENGYLEAPMFPFEGNDYIIIQPLNNKNLYNKIRFQLNTTTVNADKPASCIVLDEGLKKKIEQAEEDIEINSSYKTKNIAAKAFIQAGTQFENNYANYYDKEIALADYISFPNMTEVFREIIPWTRIMYSRKKKKIKMYSNDNSGSFPQEPLFVVDGVPTYNLDYVLGIPYSMVRSVGVVVSPEKRGELLDIGKNGLIAINTKDRKERENAIKKQADKHVFLYAGLTSTREYYTPKYTAENKMNREADFRSLLYWNPNVIIKKGMNKGAMEFYTSDQLGNYLIEIEGIASTGEPIYKTMELKVVNAN